jgi:hypothetical protein
MGAEQSKLAQPFESFCKAEIYAAKRCMNVNDFDQQKYRLNCSAELDSYKKCKKEWQEHYQKILRGE